MTGELTIADLHVEMHEGPMTIDGWYGESVAVSINGPRAIYEDGRGLIRLGLFATDDGTYSESDDFPSAEETSINVTLTKEQARVWGERLIEAAEAETRPTFGEFAGEE